MQCKSDEIMDYEDSQTNEARLFQTQLERTV